MMHSSSLPALVKFHSKTCGSCQTMENIIKELKLKFGNSINFISIDVDEHLPIAEYFDVKSVPTFILINNEVQIWRKSGLISKKEFSDLLKQQLDLL
ncbi:thioredoxin family protein [Amniculibacterium aquaticum]|uniref:thioredoxin family protein n=1 Tax=Amniculibacterium aquaticum TaxID=2479858 RepID=UPI000F59B28C|nr:thioredoxin family protein [Amniculibacterium aquaticum]